MPLKASRRVKQLTLGVRLSRNLWQRSSSLSLAHSRNLSCVNRMTVLSLPPSWESSCNRGAATLRRQRRSPVQLLVLFHLVRPLSLSLSLITRVSTRAAQQQHQRVREIGPRACAARGAVPLSCGRLAWRKELLLLSAGQALYAWGPAEKRAAAAARLARGYMSETRRSRGTRASVSKR